jgi:hypothetical protein
MDNVTNLFKGKKGFEVEYIYSGDVITGVTHTEWPYVITKNGAQRALVCKETGEPFGKLIKDDFNTLLMCWLLIDDPQLIDQAKAN